LNSFVQSFICEIYSIVRAHVSALGGNALVSLFISDLVVMPSVHKNQVGVEPGGQCYIFQIPLASFSAAKNGTLDSKWIAFLK
jgi:hypothetical protein